MKLQHLVLPIVIKFKTTDERIQDLAENLEHTPKFPPVLINIKQPYFKFIQIYRICYNNVTNLKIINLCIIQM
jgi:hypothetical protein